MKRLFVYFAGIGDLVIFVPLFKKLAESCDLDLLTRRYGEPLFMDQGYILNTYTLRHPNRGKSGLTRLLLGGHRRALGVALAEQGYDEVVVLVQERSVITDWIKNWGGKIPLKVAQFPEGDPDRLRKCFESFGLDPDDREPYPRLDISAKDRAIAKRKLSDIGDKVVSVQVGSGPTNVWLRRRPGLKGLSLQQWADLITDIIEADDIDAMVFHGTVKESRDIEDLFRLIPSGIKDKLYNWTGEIGLRHLPAVLAESYAMISVDTGPAHIAAAVGCPMLVFFGPSNPKVYPMRGDAPVELLLGKADCQFCMGTSLFKKCLDNKCMQSLDRQKLYDGWQKLIEKMV